MQEWRPKSVLREVLGHALRDQDVPGVTAIHHSLRDVNPRPRYVDSVVDILDRIDGAAVHTHAQAKARMRFQRFANFQRTLHWFLGTLKEDQRHPISRRNANQFAVRIALPELSSLPHDFIEFMHYVALFVHE